MSLASEPARARVQLGHVGRSIFGALFLAFFLLTTFADTGNLSNDPKVDPIFEDRFACPESLIADAGDDIQVDVGTPILLDGSGSTGQGCGVLFQWRILGRPQGSGTDLFDSDAVMPIFIADQAGIYEVELMVTNEGAIGESDAVTVTAVGKLESEAEIGPGGGAVGLEDGSSVLIPPGAVDDEITVAIAVSSSARGAILPPTAELVGNVYSLSPPGQSFGKPVLLVIPYDPALLPPGRSEGSISIYRQADWDEFDMVAAWNDGPEPEGLGQQQLPEEQRIVVNTILFSAYTALSVQSSSQFLPVTLTEPTASLVVRRPPVLRVERPVNHNCTRRIGSQYVHNRSQSPLASRSASDIAAIVVHSTNNGNVGRDFNGELVPRPINYET